MSAKALWTVAFPSQRRLSKARAVLSPISAKRRRDRQEYIRRKNCFLTEHPWCEVELRQTGKKVRATQVHHSRGRAGHLYLDKRYWLAVSDKGHRWIHENPVEARKLGVLAPVGKWNHV